MSAHVFIRLSRNVVCVAAMIMICIGIQSCANQQPPQGGPVDTSTPQILSTYPKNDARYFSGKRMRLTFDRYIDQRSLEESIFISPYVGNLEFDWSGKDVEITFPEKLRQNTTYVVNIGTDVRDGYRNQKRMAQAFTFAFSTGPDIDRGAIEGIAYAMKEGDAIDNIMIFAYNLDHVKEDTLNPKTLKPDFITQTGKNGIFSLRYIPFSNYRIYAIRDEYRNLLYDPNVDEYGVQSGIITITSDDTLISGVLMKLAKEDTIGPRLLKASAPDRHHLIAEFSKSINPDSVTLTSFSVIDTTTQAHLDLNTFYPSPTNRVTFTVITDDQDSTKTYRLIVKGIKDSVGNPINTLANSLVFHGSPKLDTLLPRLTEVSIKDSVRDVDFRPTLTLTFSDALKRTDSLNWINIFDNNKQTIPTKKKWVSDIVVALSPEKELASATWYTLRAELRGLRDYADRACRDSTKVWRFRTLDLEDMSSIEGVEVDNNKLDTAGRIYIEVFQVGGKAPKEYRTTAASNGKFMLSQITEGHYLLQAFRDRNDNSKYDPGNPFPFIYSERLSPLSDTLKVRARWPLEGVLIQMK